MYHGKTLVVFFCMHRSGSSFAARLLQRLGMSLGPFDLLGADESNVHGHFEAAPIVELNREIQLKAFGFDDDFPRDPAVLQRLRDGGGQWPSEAASPSSFGRGPGRPVVAFSEQHLRQGSELIQRLVDSGTVSGFKDPRTALTWPFWQRVLDRFPGLRLVALSVLRSPHEIAMSLFKRSQGDCSYGDALDITAVHFRRMKEIFRSWHGDRAVLQFQPRVLASQAPSAAAACGLPWDDSALDEVYDPQCRHNVPARVAHEAQLLYDELAAALTPCPSPDGRGELDAAPCEADNARMLHADTAAREQLLQRRCAKLMSVDAENRALQEQIESCNAEIRALLGKLEWFEAEKASWDEYKSTRGWAVLQTVWRLKRALLPRTGVALFDKPLQQERLVRVDVLAADEADGQGAVEDEEGAVAGDVARVGAQLLA